MSWQPDSQSCYASLAAPGSSDHVNVQAWHQYPLAPATAPLLCVLQQIWGVRSIEETLAGCGR